MSDYLGRRAARASVGRESPPTGEFLRPRAISVFEPPAAAAAPTDAHDQDGAAQPGAGAGMSDYLGRRAARASAGRESPPTGEFLQDGAAQLPDNPADMGSLPATRALPPARDASTPWRAATQAGAQPPIDQFDIDSRAQAAPPNQPFRSRPLWDILRPIPAVDQQPGLADDWNVSEQARSQVGTRHAEGAAPAMVARAPATAITARAHAAALAEPHSAPTTTVETPVRVGPAAPIAIAQPATERSGAQIQIEAIAAQAIDPLAAERTVLRAAPAAPLAPALPIALAPAAPPPPTIRVTIGRIEVRAKTPPARPVQRSAPEQRGPALSLDSYLKQRSGEQR